MRENPNPHLWRSKWTIIDLRQVEAISIYSGNTCSVYLKSGGQIGIHESHAISLMDAFELFNSR